jgi:hypothetical protein
MMTSAHRVTSAGVPTSRPALWALARDFDARVLEVEGVGVALGAVADDGDFFRLDQGEVCVVIVVGFGHDILVTSFVCDSGVSAVGGVSGVRPSGILPYFQIFDVRRPEFIGT